MAQESKPDKPEISEELDLFVCLHALDSAFDRILRALKMLRLRMALSVESVQARSASIEAIRAAVNLELREMLGESGLKNFDEFSRNIRQMEHQLISECLAKKNGENITIAEA